MRQKISVKKIWSSSFELMVKRPVVILPFVVIAFIEALALELIYFSNRPPLSLLAGPLISKLSGEIFLHYPFNLAKIPRYFYYTQLVIYVLIGILLSAITVNAVKNIREGLPLKANAVIKNAFRKYFSFLALGVIAIILIQGLRSFNMFIYPKIAGLAWKNMQLAAPKLYMLGMSVFYFFTSLLLHTFFVMAMPILVLEKKPLVKAILGSMAMGLRNFFGIIVMIFLPFVLYFPVTMLKAYATEFGVKLFPEVTLWILAAGIVAAIFTDCFVIICAAQFLMEKAKK